MLGELAQALAFRSTDGAGAGAAASSLAALAAAPLPTESEAIEHATGLLLSFGVVRSPAGQAGILEPKDVGSGGWCFFHAFFDQLGPTSVPSSVYLAVLALEAMADRHHEFAPGVVGVDFEGVEVPVVRAARAALWQVPAYRALGVVELLTPFECSVLDKFEGVLAGDLLDERRYADDSEMLVLLEPAGLEVLVLESNDVICRGDAARSRVHPSRERCGEHVFDRLCRGMLDMVFVRYELGSYTHYVSVAFGDGQPWNVSAAKRGVMESLFVASALCTAVRRSDL